MPTNRVFAYNPTSLVIPGITNIGTLAYGPNGYNYYNNYGGLTWWGGPDEDLGYCIGTVVPAQNQSTPLGNIGSVQFWRTTTFSESEFTSLASNITGLSFPTALSAQTYLNANSYWSSIVLPLYTFTTFTFTPVGATGPAGPTSLQTQTAYNSQAFYPTYFSNVSGRQDWTVPVNGSYVIECVGASGGNGLSGVLGGKAAKITGTFTLTQGTVLKLVVGQLGQTQNATYGSGGGGGGSYVVNGVTPLIVAGGGGGGGFYSPTSLAGNPASLTVAGNLGSITNGNGGDAGTGTGAAGGGGLNSNGIASGYGQVGRSFFNGSLGGVAYTAGNGDGGFGGGAGAGFSGGGGAGGYSGGDGGNNGAAPPPAGGGGSYNNGTSQLASLMTTVGNGYITITKL